MDSLNTITLSQLIEMIPSDRDSNEGVLNMGDDFFITRNSYSSSYTVFRYPCRVDGYLAAFCQSGSLTLRIDLREYTLGEGMMVITAPGNIIMVEPSSGQSNQFVMIGISRDFMTSLNVEVGRLFKEALSVLRDPCITLSAEERDVAALYVQLAYSILTSESPYMKDSILSLSSSMFYHFGGFLYRRIHAKGIRPAAETPPASRHRLLFERFISLVADYHETERMVGFYADRLCITPKYLSRIVREVSGKSAPQWISDYVILEAKNLLKYSSVPIKEVADRLSFPSQSFFFKFFRRHTGMTPRQYRNSSL